MRVLLLAVAAVLCFGSLLRAEPADARKRGEEMRKQFMAKFDKNKDGKIDDAEKKAVREEFGKRMEDRKKEFMAKYDKNKDGKLDEAEKKAIAAEWQKRRQEHQKAEPKKEAPKKAELKKECPKAAAKKECPKAAAKKECPKAEAAKSARGEWAKRMEAHKKEFMAKYDKNKDGKIDDKEKAAIKAEMSRAISGAIVGGLDKSDDGKLNVDEVPQRLREHFGKADRDKDGYVDKTEVKAAMDEAGRKLHARMKERAEAHHKHPAEGHKRPAAKEQGPSREEALMKRLMYGDKNKDGRLNADEMPERLRQRFGAMDANGDGYVDRDELKKVVAALLKR